jgi:hypothetical protein
MSNEKLRKRLLSWHYRKVKGTGIVDLLESTYQCFRYKVQQRVDRTLNFREAIVLANDDELEMLDIIRIEARLNI